MYISFLMFQQVNREIILFSRFKTICIYF